MKREATRRTVDLSGYPDLVVVYLGMRANVLTGEDAVRPLAPLYTGRPYGAGRRDRPPLLYTGRLSGARRRDRRLYYTRYAPTGLGGVIAAFAIHGTPLRGWAA